MPEPADDEKAKRNYEAEQKQRYMERMIRMYKRLEAGTLDPETQAKYSRKVKEWQGKLREHTDKHPDLRRDRKREQIEGSLTHHERNQVLKKAADNEKIEEVRKFIRSDAQPKTIHVGRQNKHIEGTHEYKQKQREYQQKKQYGPSRVSITEDDIKKLVDEYAGTGKINLNKNGEWDQKEVIITNERIIGVSVNNLNGKEVDTSVFKIHYADDGFHLVPDYPSKKRRKQE